MLVRFRPGAPFLNRNTNRGTTFRARPDRGLKARFSAEYLYFVLGNDDPVDNRAEPRLARRNLADRKLFAQILRQELDLSRIDVQRGCAAFESAVSCENSKIAFSASFDNRALRVGSSAGTICISIRQQRHRPAASDAPGAG